jgi:hypothetical protein
MPFTIGVETPLQKVQMLQHGHTNSVYVDAIFGTNEKNVLILSWYWLSYISPMCCVNGEVHIIHRYRAHNEQIYFLVQFPLYIMMLFNEWFKCLLVMYNITSNNNKQTLLHGLLLWKKIYFKKMTIGYQTCSLLMMPKHKLSAT